MSSNALMGGIVSGLCTGVFCFLFAVIRDVFATKNTTGELDTPKDTTEP